MSDLQCTAANGRSSQRLEMAGPQFTPGVHLHFKVATLHPAGWDVAVSDHRRGSTQRCHHADNSTQYDCHDCPDNGSSASHASRTATTPSPLDRAALPDLRNAGPWRS